MGRNKKKKE